MNTASRHLQRRSPQTTATPSTQPSMTPFPPHGANFRALPTANVAAACRGLHDVLSFLSELPAAGSLRRYDDWLEHDGLMLPGKKISFAQALDLVRTPDSLLECTPDEHEVRVGIAPSDNTWCLRFRAEWDDDEHAIVASFDLTVPSAQAEPFATAFSTARPLTLTREDAADYFPRLQG